MLDRRQLTKGLAATLVGVQLATPQPGLARSVDAPENWCGRQFISRNSADDFDILRTLVDEHASASEAREMVKHLAWYFQQPSTDDGESRIDIIVEEMTDPPGIHLTWTTVSGESAVEAYHEAAFFHRDIHSWNIKGNGHAIPGSPSIIPDIVQDLVTREAGTSAPEPGLDEGGLWNLLPSEDDLGGGYRLDSFFDPTGSYDPDGTPQED